jgi:hypothetical protein
MRFRGKYFYGAALFVLWALSFFGYVSLPKDARSAMDWLTATETWISYHVAHPIFFALFTGLAFSTVILPEIWPYAKPRWFPPKSRPDISAAIAYKTILEGSKLAKELTGNWKSLPGQPYETSKPESQIINGRVEKRLKTNFHTKLRQGDLVSWGCPINGTELEEKIPAERWADIEMWLEPRDLANDGVCAWKIAPDQRNRRLAFTRVRLCKNELYREYPLTWRARLMRRKF